MKRKVKEMYKEKLLKFIEKQSENYIKLISWKNRPAFYLFLSALERAIMGMQEDEVKEQLGKFLQNKEKFKLLLTRIKNNEMSADDLIVESGIEDKKEMQMIYKAYPILSKLIQEGYFIIMKILEDLEKEFPELKQQNDAENKQN